MYDLSVRLQRMTQFFARMGLYLILSLLCIETSAQKLKVFSTDSEKFMKQLKGALEDSGNKQGKELFSVFAEMWANGSFTGTEQDQIIGDLNKILKKRGRTNPHLISYLNAVMAFVNQSHDEVSRQNWQAAIDFMLTKRGFQLAKLNAFLISTRNLIADSVLYQSSSAKWKYTGGDLEYVFENEHVRVVFDTINLSAFSPKDSIKIFRTTGYLDPLNKQWIGKKGLVTWEKASFSRDSVYANLNKYKIYLARTSYDADSVLFVNKQYTLKPILGHLSDKTIVSGNGNRISYPQFNSYEAVVEIKNIYENIDYQGGFSMYGNRFLSTGENNAYSSLIINRKDSASGKFYPFMRCTSSDFIFRTDFIASAITGITIYIDQDSIYHPGLTFRYYTKNREVFLSRTGEGMSRSPFYNSYHQLDMDFEQINWRIDDPKIDFSQIKGGESRAAVFESANYFSAERYYGLQGLDKNHPYIGLARYYNEYKTKSFYADDYARFLRMPITDVRQKLMELSYLGVIDYDVQRQKVTLRDRLFYYLQAVVGRTDYDVITFMSNPGMHQNASLNLLTNELKIYGVPQIQLSDSQNVMIYPAKGEILVKKNRNFEFDGAVSAGKFDFYGKKFNFNYDNFGIDMQNIDSLRIWVSVMNKQGMASLVKIRTVIQDITGDLLIDKPDNKSGKEDYPEFPIFNSNKPSYVYYDKYSIQSGVYTRDKFYFQIDPYTIDSLDVFSTRSLQFDGTFTSANIFPEFREKLRVQEDLSLGFKRLTPPSGFPIYVDKGNYKNQISLSNQGLRGNGELSYLTASMQSDDYLFYPDSTNSLVQSFSITKQVSSVEYPQVSGANDFVHWLPYQDEMYISSKETDFNMYADANLAGRLKLEPTGLQGGGFMQFNNAELTSDLYDYKANTFHSDSARFDLLTSEADGFAFRTEDVSADVNFITRKGHFELNQEERFVEIPPIEYICSMDVFDWYMDKEELDMSVSWLNGKTSTFDPNVDPFTLADTEGEGSEFISVQPLQDSLQFVAALANYKIKEMLLTATGVKNIEVADASILPDKGIVQVERKAIMRTLENARIIANTESKFHLLYNAEVNIFSRNNYNANANYDYVDELNRKQQIHFNVVGVSDSLQTYATGNISDSSNFMLNPQFRYKGKVKLEASNEFLYFDGGALMSFDCPKLNPSWLAFESYIEPNLVYIPVSENPLDIDGNKLKAGVYMHKDSTHLYTAFLSRPKKYSDVEIMASSGFLYFDKDLKQYQIGEKLKIDDPETSGTLLSMNKANCRVEGEGKIDLGVYTGQIKIKSAGFLEHDLNKDTIQLDVAMILDFFFPSNVFDIMVEDFYNDPDLEPADLGDDVFVKALPELLGQDQANEAFNNLSLYGEYRKMPKELDKALVISNVTLIWNSSTRSYISYGPIGISNMGKTQISRLVDGKIEFRKTRSINEFTFYFQLGSEKWYYLEYNRNNLYAVSSNENFNFGLKDLSADKRSNDVKGEPPLTVVPANERKRRYFLRKFDFEDLPEED